jgi:hypothetical protein
LLRKFNLYRYSVVDAWLMIQAGLNTS